MFLMPSISFYQKGELVGSRLAMIGLTLLFAVCLMSLFIFMLWRAYRHPYVLEFSPTEIIDRRFLKLSRVPYEDIAIFSPPLESIFRPNPRLREIQNELEIGEYLMLTCHLKTGARAQGPAVKKNEFFFSDHIEPQDLSDSKLEIFLTSRLANKGIQFETLYEIDD